MTTPNLRSIRVTRVLNTIFIPLPPELWRLAGDGQCVCPVCRADGTIGYWDTLAVTAIVRNGVVADTTWTVHNPGLHPRAVRLAKIEADKEAQGATQ